MKRAYLKHGVTDAAAVLTGPAKLSQAKLMCSAKRADAALSWSVSRLQGPARADAALPHCADRRGDVVLRDAALPPRQAGHQGRERLGRDAPGAAAAAAAGGKLFICCSSSVMCSVLSVFQSTLIPVTPPPPPSLHPTHPTPVAGLRSRRYLKVSLTCSRHAH